MQDNGTLAVEDVPAPTPARGQLVLRVERCGICGSDLHAVHSMARGTILGHEFAGEVVSVGEGVDAWKVGDRAVSLPFFSCGTCERCRRGDVPMCLHNRGIGIGAAQGAYAELVAVQAENTLHVPAGVTFREAALVEPLAVGLHAIRRSGLAAGETCIILGAGPIGIATMLWARAIGAQTVVSEPAPGRRAIAERLGGTVVVDPSTTDPGVVALELGGGNVAKIFECVGAPRMIQDAMTMSSLRTQIVVLGICMAMDELFPILGIVKEIGIQFVLCYTAAEFREALDALATRRLDVGPMITDVISLDDVPAMFETLAAPAGQCKVQIESSAPAH